jgi:hypothetical protein
VVAQTKVIPFGPFAGSAADKRRLPVLSTPHSNHTHAIKRPIAAPVGVNPFAQPEHRPTVEVPYAAKYDWSTRIDMPHVRQSSIDTWNLCKRKWAFSQLHGFRNTAPDVEDDPKTATEIGTAVHKAHELWLRDGVPYDRTTRIGQIAAATMHLLPAPGTCRVESGFRLNIRGIKLGGTIDLDYLHEHPSIAIVSDHKTCGDFKYAKLEREKLLGHPQAPIYALAGVIIYQREIVDLRWNYATREKRPRVRQSWHRVFAHELEGLVAPHLQTAERITEAVEHCNEDRRKGREHNAHNYPGDPRACWAFGGCEHRAYCGADFDTGALLYGISNVNRV